MVAPVRHQPEDEASRKKALYQKELLQQIEERKRREKELKERTKQEDLLDLQRIEREIAKERQTIEAQNQPRGQNQPGQGNPNVVDGVFVPKPKGKRQPAANLNSDQNLQSNQINNAQPQNPAAFNTNISKQYLAQHRSTPQDPNHPPTNQPQPEIPLMEVLSQVTDLEPPQIPVVRVEPTVSRQYLQASRQPTTAKPLTVSTVRREVQGELQRQLAGMQRPDGDIYRQIDKRFEEGFGGLRLDLQKANQELLDNLERIKRETKEALLSKEKALQELEGLKMEIDKPKMNHQYQKPFGGIVKDEIDDLIRKYSSTEQLPEYNEYRPSKGNYDQGYAPNYNSNGQNDSGVNRFPQIKSRQESSLKPQSDYRIEGRQEGKNVDRFKSQPIRYPAGKKEVKAEAMYGSINLDVIFFQ